MIPIGDNVARHRSPTVTRALVAANVIAFCYELYLGRRLDGFVGEWGVVPALVSRTLAEGTRAPPEVLLTLIASQFLHAGWIHLGGNLLFLWIFGDAVEDRFGHVRFAGFYLLCGIAAALTQVWMDPSSRVPLIGASGAISGVLGAYFLLFPTAWVTVLLPVFVLLLPVPVPAVLLLALWFASQLISGVGSLTSAHAAGGVAFWAHIGGFATGLALTAITPRARSDRRASRSPRRSATRIPGRRVAALVVRLTADVLALLLALRLIAVALAPRAGGSLAVAIQAVIVWSAPLVAPFAELLPAIRTEWMVLELYTLLALVVYHLLLALLAGLLRR
ncbi:MAG: rhomboid family intramembrane serine protease [Chloroflexota bacterium]